MIRVDRDQLDENGSPVRPSEAWFRKASDATRKALDEGAEHKFSDLYRDDEVRKALEKLFCRKCAYCDGPLGIQSPWDIEHYRPRGAVAERLDHPGYYWLAYIWANLYPACTYCNQRRYDRPIWAEPVIGPSAGKGTSFPLADESARAMTAEDDLERERPLLLTPCLPGVDPEQHFRYDARGEIHALLPKDARAQATIRICHLQRRRLRDDRARVVQTTLRFLRLLEQVRAKLGPEDPAVVELQQMLNRQVHDDAPYAGAARYVLCDPGAF